MLSEIHLVKQEGVFINEATKDVLHINETCCICLSQYEDENVILRTACNHDFHKICLVQWMWENKNCPLCKKEITKSSKQTDIMKENIFRVGYKIWIVMLCISFVCCFSLISCLTNRGPVERAERSTILHEFPFRRIQQLCDFSSVLCFDGRSFISIETDGEKSIHESCVDFYFVCQRYTNPVAQHFIVSDTSLDSWYSVVFRMMFLFMLFPLLLTFMLSVVLGMLSLAENTRLTFLFATIAIFSVCMICLYLKILILFSASFF